MYINAPCYTRTHAQAWMLGHVCNVPSFDARNLNINIYIYIYAYQRDDANRAQINLSLCNANNLGDVTARATSQTIACSIAGTALALGISYGKMRFMYIHPIHYYVMVI